MVERSNGPKSSTEKLIRAEIIFHAIHNWTAVRIIPSNSSRGLSFSGWRNDKLFEAVAE
jgi:hypothetical protein